MFVTEMNNDNKEGIFISHGIQLRTIKDSNFDRPIFILLEICRIERSHWDGVPLIFRQNSIEPLAR